MGEVEMIHVLFFLFRYSYINELLSTRRNFEDKQKTTTKRSSSVLVALSKCRLIYSISNRAEIGRETKKNCQ